MALATSRDGVPSYNSIPPSPVENHTTENDALIEEAEYQRGEERRFLSQHASEPQNFTLRGILVGLGVGLIVCFSNMYFGLQSEPPSLLSFEVNCFCIAVTTLTTCPPAGWVSVMSMPSALIGFAFFQSLKNHLDIPFTPVENVLVQTVAGAMGTMPLGCGFVGVMPALNYLLAPEEGGAVFLSMWQMMLWALGLCFFGVVFAVPLRRQVIIREKLKFPSGTATALMISVLHGQADLKEDAGNRNKQAVDEGRGALEADTGFVATSSALGARRPSELERRLSMASCLTSEADEEAEARKWATGSWRQRVKLLIIAFAISGVYTFATYFFPILRNLPIFGGALASNWLWTLNPSPAYVGQGIIMGPATTAHMLLGAIVGWGILSPLAKHMGWAPGPVSDWETGSKGWIIWVSLAIMLADSIISLGYIALRSLVHQAHRALHLALEKRSGASWKELFRLSSSSLYTPLNKRGSSDLQPTQSTSTMRPLHMTSSTVSATIRDLPDVDAPPEHLVSMRTVWIALTTSVLFCILAIRVAFGPRVPIWATTIAVLLALVLSIMGVRALGETDLNPVSGISKLAQLFFALIIPKDSPNAVLINLVAGAVSEAGALQAGDLMQDLKTGHLLGAAPNAQFYGQMIGSAVGAVVSAWIYALYTKVYEVPGDLFQVPTAYVWVFTAHLVTGKGLPEMVGRWAIGAAVIFAATTVTRLVIRGSKWHPWIPGGIAVAVGMYNVPSFTLARAIGGAMNWYWKIHLGKQETPLVVVASGLVLGEGVVSILSLVMASAGVPHF